ncbi:MAG: hypothetical protein JWQ16_1077, partial [Novosphingobium sp.]|nr:hypothetical protein [Novosphingobium sp.]
GILLVPDLESGNMLAKQLTFLFGQAGATLAATYLNEKAKAFVTHRSAGGRLDRAVRRSGAR